MLTASMTIFFIIQAYCAAQSYQINFIRFTGRDYLNNYIELCLPGLSYLCVKVGSTCNYAEISTSFEI